MQWSILNVKNEKTTLEVLILWHEFHSSRLHVDQGHKEHVINRIKSKAILMTVSISLCHCRKEAATDKKE